jgi:hypothetical protein
VDEEQGIHRGEVPAIVGVLADIYSDTGRILWALGEGEKMGTNPKNWTPDEWRAWREAREARLRDLRAHIARIEAELAAKKK